MTENAPRLDIVDGPHAGATASLHAGRCLIGRSGRCDLVLQDALLAPQHARLHIVRGAVTVTALARPAALDGRPLAPGARVALRTGQRLTLGRTSLRLSAPTRGEATAHARRGAFTPRRVWAAALLSGGALLVSAAGTAPQPRPTPRAQAEQTLRELALPGLDLRDGSDGVLELHGFVADAAAQRRLRRALGPLAGALRQRVWADDATAATAVDTLRAHGLDGVRADASAGVVRLSGYSPSSSALRRAAAAIGNDVGGVRRVETDDVADPAQRRRTLRALAADYDLDGRLTIAASADGLVVSGALDDDALRRWRALSATFAQRYPHLRLLDRVNRRPPLRLSVRGVSVGATAFVTARDGRRYRVGDTLPGGYRLRAIGVDRLLLADAEQQTYVHPLGEQP